MVGSGGGSLVLSVVVPSVVLSKGDATPGATTTLLSRRERFDHLTCHTTAIRCILSPNALAVLPTRIAVLLAPSLAPSPRAAALSRPRLS